MIGCFVYDFPMGNLIRHTTELALHLVRPYVTPDCTVIDATCGNGHDTLALAQMEPARLYAFDVQEEAVRATVKLLEGHGYSKSMTDGRIRVCRAAHEEMRRTVDPAGCSDTAGTGTTSDCPGTPGVPAPVRTVVFNLGYLPGGNKELTTKTESTIRAVGEAMDLIAPDGVICITMYSGHAEGKREKAALLDLAQRLDPVSWHTAYVSMPNQKQDPPEILLITRKK